MGLPIALVTAVHGIGTFPELSASFSGSTTFFFPIFVSFLVLYANLLLWAYIAKGKQKGCYFPGNMTSGKR